jgi:TetR/AcrR family transcriptional regulator, repressor for neighboring sulfatase
MAWNGEGEGVTAKKVGEAGVRGRPTQDPLAPHGPDQVRDTVVQAAARLFAQRGVAGVSVRQVARAAGVNLGLVHRYVGTKEDLIRAALLWAAEEMAHEVDQADNPILTGSTSELVGIYERLIAQLSLEGYDLRELGLEFPMMRSLIDQMVDAGVNDYEARLRAVCSVALAAWRVLEPLVAAATQLDPDDVAAVGAAISDSRHWLSMPNR